MQESTATNANETTTIASRRHGRPPKDGVRNAGPTATPTDNPSTRTVEAKQKFPAVSLGLSNIRAQITVITPELAAKWLGSHPQVQRPRQPSLVAMIARAIDEDRWEFNGEPIIFNDAGELADGQHRLAACIESGKSIVAIVIYGVPKKAFWTIDTGSSRTAPDALKASGYTYTTMIASACRLLWYADHGMTPMSDREMPNQLRPKLSPVEIRKTLEKHPDLPGHIPAVTEASKITRSPGLTLFCYYLMQQIDRDAAQEFFAKLGSGEELRSGQPVFELRRRFLGSRAMFTAPEKLRLIYKAWNAYRHGETIGALRVRTGDPLPELV